MEDCGKGESLVELNSAPGLTVASPGDEFRVDHVLVRKNPKCFESKK